jgi:hypothetical protein
LIFIENLLSKSGSPQLLGSSTASSGPSTSFLSSIDWNTARYLVFILAFGLVFLYQYCKWKKNRTEKQLTQQIGQQKRQMQSSGGKGGSSADSKQRINDALAGATGPQFD